MNTAYILLGSNDGDRLQHLATALTRMKEEAGALVKESAIYTTVAWGYTEQPDFLNQVVCIQTDLTPQQLLSALLSIEKEMGRVRGHAKWMQRIIDLDILFYNQDVINESHLHIPHPHLQDRKFVLVPLKEIAASYMHPVLKKDVATLTAACKDTLEVQKLIITT
ncbi:MAG TPA: 2-amino-4-hydroxy-6-hydroxymethyldihydropteridine diphosphokinase [Bacteroidia bacterium]|nr:2-amino-4-hydroxy-6-hydroxymethyldihydropteridine diphosphokinase [Bacteroidia bacterium]